MQARFEMYFHSIGNSSQINNTYLINYTTNLIEHAAMLSQVKYTLSKLGYNLMLWFDIPLVLNFI